MTRFLPSRLLDAVAPAPVREKLGPRYGQITKIADAVWTGDGAGALSARTAMLAFSVRIASAFIAYASQVLLALWLGAHEFGIYVWVWIAATLTGNLSSIGLSSAVVRFIPEYQASGDTASLRGIIFGSRIISIGVATTVMVLGMAGLYFAKGNVADYYIVPAILALTCFPMLALVDAQDGIARSHDWVGLALSPTFLARPLLTLLGMVAVLQLGYPADAVTAMAVTVASTWVIAVMQLLMLNQRLAGVMERGPRNWKPKLWITVALPIFLVEGFFALLTNVDILLVGAYMKPADVAVYFACVKIIGLVHFVFFAVKAGAAHRYSQYYAEGSHQRYASYVRDTVKWTFWPSAALAVVLLAVGQPLLAMFGDGFETGYPLLFVLVIGIVVRASVGPAESVLNMSGQQNICAFIYAGTLLVNVVLNVSLIPAYGLVGAAWATTIAMVGETVVLYFIIVRRLGLHMFVLGHRDLQPAGAA